MSRSVAARVSATVAAIGAIGATLLAAGGPAAAADPAASGTTTLSVPLGVEAALAKSGLATLPQSPASIGYDQTNQAVTETFPVTAGTAKVSTLTGHLDLGGSLLLFNFTNGKCVTFGSLVFDLFHDQITGVPSGSTSPVALFDTVGARHVETDGTTNTFTASDLTVDTAGASYLDTALGTSLFVAGQDAGSFSSSWEFTG